MSSSCMPLRSKTAAQGQNKLMVGRGQKESLIVGPGHSEQSQEEPLRSIRGEDEEGFADAQDPPKKQSKSRKRIWTVTDPLDFPPNEYHRSLFKCSQPFINLTDKMPEYNKFGGLKMKVDTRKEAMQFMLDPIFCVFRSHEFKGELGGRALHSALLGNIWGITAPSKRYLGSIADMEASYELLHNRKRQRIEQDICEGENVDLVIGEVEELEKLESSSSKRSNESSEVVEETRPDDGEQTGRGRVDMKLSVYNSSNQKLKEKFEENDSVNSEKTICIVECKWGERDAKALYQGACYACQEAVNNLSNLHFEPIYILVLTDREWTYGILDIRGTIGVTKGRIDRDTFPAFSKQETIRFPEDHMSIGPLEAQLGKRTAYYRQRFKSCPNAVYPTNVYLVGTLHTANRWYGLPIFGKFAGLTDIGVHRFYEGLMRLIIGDKVVGWEKEDVKKAIGLREKLMKIEKELSWGGV